MTRTPATSTCRCCSGGRSRSTAAKDRDKVLDLFRESSLWRAKMVRGNDPPAADETLCAGRQQKDYQTCIELFRLAPEKKHGRILLKAFEEAFKGRSSAGLPDELLAEIAKLGGGSIAFGVRQGKDDAIAKALSADPEPEDAAATARIELIDIFGEAKQPRCVDPLLALLGAAPESAALQKATLGSLQAYKDDKIGAEVVRLLPGMPAEVREVAEALLVGRREWSRQLLAAVDDGKDRAKSIPLATLRKLLLHRDDQIAQSGQEALGRSQRRDHRPDATGHRPPRRGRQRRQGRSLPRQETIHRPLRQLPHLARRGRQRRSRPDSVQARRRRQLLLHIVNPNAEIREGYESSVVITESGRTLTRHRCREGCTRGGAEPWRTASDCFAEGRHRIDERERYFADARRACWTA